MKETAKEKSAKKPRPERATLASLNRKVDLMDSRLRTLKAWETMQDAMEESRSAPAEAWVPKVGDWVVVTAKSGLFLRGHISKVCRTGPQGGVYLNQPNMADGCCVERKHLRPATPAEIADHERMIEEHRKYGDKLRFGHWADIAARKVVSHLRDMGYLRPSQAIGEQTPVAYTMSRDYCALYDLLCEGRDAFCLVDMSFTNPDHVCRDVARVRRRKEWRIDIGARGIGYGDVSPYSENRHATERDALVDECKRMNLEWVAPISPEARDKAIEALVSIGKDAREVFDHGTSLLTVKAGSGRIIAVSDRALSALRK